MVTAKKYILVALILVSLLAFNLSITEADLEHKIPVIVELYSDKLIQVSEVKHNYNYFNGFSARVTEQEFLDLQNNPNVKAVYEDKLFKIALDSSAPQVNASLVWNLQYNFNNITGKDQTICVIDTGVAYNHSALGNCTTNEFLNGNCEKVVGGYDFCENADCSIEDSDPMDGQGHGSHVAGIVASNDITYRGIAPDAKIFAVKVLNSEGLGYASDVAAGIDMCLGNSSDYNISAIVMSFVAVEANGTEKKFTDVCDNEAGSYGLVVDAANNAAANGLYVVAAAGNSGYNDGICLPACASNVTSVASVDADDTDSGYNIDNLLDLFAPGTAIKSTHYVGGFTDKSGTSMAAPHVAAAALLMKQYELLESASVLMPEEITSIFKNTGKTISSRGYDIPRINIKAAIEQIDNTPTASISNLNEVSTGFSNITIDWTNPLDPDFNHAEVWADGIFRGNSSNNEYTITSLLANTEYEIQVKAVDDSLNVNETFVGINSTTLTDNELPSIYLISPENNSNISQGTTIDLEAYDNGEIFLLWYSKNGEANQTLNSPYNIDTSTWLSGEITLTVSANDTGGNLNTTEFFFSMNSSAPSVENVRVLPLDADSADDLVCNYTFIDLDNNPESAHTIIKWYLDGNETSVFENLSQIPNINVTRTQKWNCSVKPHDGGLYGTTETSNETIIQNAAPTIAVTYPDGGEELTDTITITWTSNDTESDNITFTIFYSANSGTDWTEITNSINLTLSWNTSLVTNGNDYRIGVNASDVFGASGFDSSNDDFVINNTATDDDGNGGDSGDSGDSSSSDDEQAAGGGGITSSDEPEPSSESIVEEVSAEDETETPGITGSAIADFLKGNAGTALVIAFVLAAIIAALVLFAKRNRIKVPRFKKTSKRRKVRRR